MPLKLFQPDVVVVTQAGRVGRTLQINKRNNEVLVDFVDGKPQWVDGVGSLCWTDYESVEEYLANWGVRFFDTLMGKPFEAPPAQNIVHGRMVVTGHVG